MSHSPLSRYQMLIEQCEITPDPAQKDVVIALQNLFSSIDRKSVNFLKSILISDFISNKINRKGPAGIYLWGGVGRGKSMLMDLFYEALPFKEKRRVHFHAFMQEVHRRIHDLRQDEGVRDPLLVVANEIARAYQVLCFDELQVHDIADAMILSRLFMELFDKGMTVIFTSNRPPQDLYKDGLQREHFLPFIYLIQKIMQIIEIKSEEDYRKRNMAALSTTYFTPLGPDADQFIQESFLQLTQHAIPNKEQIEIQGRILDISKCCREMVWFTFDELCARPLGTADYLELATVFHTFFIKDIPRLNKEKRNEAKRFVSLIDVLYESKARLICTADALPEALYPTGDGSFEFERTASRLIEMQTDNYWNESQPDIE